MTHLEVKRSKFKVTKVKRASVSLQGPQLVSPSDDYVYKYWCKGSKFTLYTLFPLISEI